VIVLSAFFVSAHLSFAQGSIGLPVIFVHGICETADNFLPAEQAAKATLQTNYPLLYPASQDYVAFYDGTTVWFQTPPANGAAAGTPTTAEILPATARLARFFLVALHDPVPNRPSYEQFDPNTVADVSIYAKGYELARIIWTIKTITQAPRAIVVGHSMGGLDARAYIEGLASPTGDIAVAIPYLNDVAALVTLDTPHLGADITQLGSLVGPVPNWLGLSCQANPSIDKSEMLPGGAVITQLNYQDQPPAAQPLPPGLTITSIESTWAPLVPVEFDWPGTDNALFGFEQDLGSVPGIGDHSQSSLGSQTNVFDAISLLGISLLCGNIEPLHSLTCTGSSSQTYSLIETAIDKATPMNNGTLQISPVSTTVSANGTIQFTVANSVGNPTWSIREGANAGTVSPNGLFTAPATLSGSAETVHVEVIDSANPNQYAEATIQVTASDNADQTFTALTANSATVVLGKTLSLSAQVTATAGVPSGGVTFLDGTNPLGTLTLNGSGIASFNTNNLSAGSHSLTASYQGNGSYQSSASPPLTVTVTPPPSLPLLTSLTISPWFVTSGQSATLTATLSGPAPATGATISLTPSNPAAFPAPASIFIPAGQTSATSAPVVSGSVSSATQVVVNGNYNNDVTQQGAVEITTIVPHPLSIALTPSQATVNPGQSVTITAVFTGATAGAPTGLAHFSDTFNGTTTVIGNVALSPSSTSGQYLATLLTGALLAGQHQFVVVYNGDNTYGAQVSNVAAVISQQLQPSLVISSFSITPVSIVGGYPALGVVTLTGNAPAGGATIALSSNNPHYAQIPETATVTAGYNNVAFFINTPYTSGAGGATISAAYNGTQYGASFTVLPVAVGGVTFYPSTITAGQSVSFTVYLTGPAGAGTVVSLVSSNPAALQVPASVTAATGATSVTVTGTTAAVSSQTTVSVTATYNGSSGQGSLTVMPAPVITLSNLYFAPNQLTGGANASAFVGLTALAPTGGVTVSLSSSSSSVLVPPTVTIPAGTWYLYFTVPTSSVSSNTNAVVSASYAGSSLSAPITLYPPLPFMQSISFSPSTVTGGSSTTGTVTLTTVVPQNPNDNPAWISLAWTGAYLENLPNGVEVPIGSLSATFNVPTSPTNFILPLIATASYNGTSAGAELVVTPAGTPLAPASLTLTPLSVIGGSAAAGVILLTGPAPSGGATLTVSADSSVVQTPLTVAVPPGATSVTIAIATTPVSAISTSTITAAMNGVSQSSLLTIMPSTKPNPGNPVPFLAAPLAPVSHLPNGAAIPVTVDGSGFVSGAQILWNGSPLPTNFESQSQLQASVPATDTLTNGTALITVSNPGSSKLISNTFPMHLRYPTPAPSFNTSELTISGDALGVSTGDFNRDGRLDIVVAKDDGSGLSVFLGNGDGTFGAERLLTGPTLLCTAVGDLNGDGKLDIVGVVFNGSAIATLLGNGDGTFTGGITTSVPNPGYNAYVALADFNRDGILDLVVTTAKGVSVFLGVGDGTFGQPSNFALANQPSKVAIADFDGDGLLDLAATDNPNNQSIAVLRGNGDGTFSEPVEYGSNGYAVDLAVADFNGDGHPDIAVANEGPVGSSGSGIAILMNNGNGTFSAPTTLTPGQIYYAVATEDINGDGNLDLVVTADTPSLANEIFLGNGNGTFSTQPISLGTAVNSPAAIVDFNGDGAPDILLTSYNGAPATLLIQATAPIVRAVPGSLSLTVQQGAAASAPVSFTISNTGGGTATWSASSSQPWLQISQSAGSPPSIVQATANTAGMNAGSYSAVITITMVGASNTPLAIPVTLTVQPIPVVISSLSAAPSVLVGGESAVGTITLTGTAPAGGYTVSISSSSGAVQVPSSITIGAGQTSGTFSVIASSVTVSTQVSLTATYGETSANATITLNPSVMSSANYGGVDTTTQGAWTGKYGSLGQVIANDVTNLPGYAAVSFTGASSYTWATSTTDARALQTASGASTRIASTYYSSTSFTINVDLADGNMHKLSLYLLDWDGSARTETISILDAHSNAVLDTENYSSFHNGEYAIWNVQGDITIKVTKTGGANAVVAGIFLDPAAAPVVAKYNGVNTTTQGTWTGDYGADGHLIANETAAPPPYATISLTGDSSYTWSASTTDPRALQTASGATTRIASAFYSSSSFTINVNLTDGNTHRIALYLLDWDSTARSETISILDANTDAVLDTETYSGFHNGEYASWNVQGQILIQVTKTGGSNAVVSGIFFDPPSNPGTASYVGLDTTTQGTWTSVYGSTGDIIANDANNTPTFATVALTADSAYTWAASTTDVRALQTASGASTRIASTYYSPTSFTINVNLTDGNTHKISLYLLDWDSALRAETIRILDANTNTVLDTESYSGFHNGQYAAWSVKGHVLIQVTKTGGSNAVVSGIFFD
jgi:pimeloyl-ACP methyl ester carboxylesterase